jgi:hypothetical protein
MKLSQFKRNSVKKIMKFVNGEIQYITPQTEKINGEISFYDLDIFRLNLINEKVVMNLKEEDTNDYFMYKLIPFVSDVEVDVTFDEYLEMIMLPSDEFTSFMDLFLKIIEEMFALLDNLVETHKTAEEVGENISALENIIPQEVEEVNIENNENVDIEKTDIIEDEEESISVEVQIEQLFQKLTTTTDREERNKIIQNITDLQSQLR